MPFFVNNVDSFLQSVASQRFERVATVSGNLDHDDEAGEFIEAVVGNNSFGSKFGLVMQLVQHLRAWKIARYCEGDFIVVAQDDQNLAANAREKLDEMHDKIVEHLKHEDFLFLTNGDFSKPTQPLYIKPLDTRHFDGIGSMYAVSRRGIQRAIATLERLEKKCSLDVFLTFCLDSLFTLSSHFCADIPMDREQMLQYANMKQIVMSKKQLQTLDTVACEEDFVLVKATIVGRPLVSVQTSFSKQCVIASALEPRECQAFDSKGVFYGEVISFARSAATDECAFVSRKFVDQVAHARIALRPESQWTLADAIEIVTSEPVRISWEPKFSIDWHSQFAPFWIDHVPSLVTRYNNRILEVGSYEGKSTLWFLQHALKGDQAMIDCIDTWTGSVEHDDCFSDQDKGVQSDKTLEAMFRHNMGPYLNERVMMTKGKSQDILPQWLAQFKRGERQAYDVVYIDGSHMAKDVLMDAVLSFEMLSEGGHIIFDDYEWNKKLDAPMIPRTAIDAFLAVYEGRVRVLHKEWQVIAKKVSCQHLYEKSFYDAQVKLAYPE